MRNPPRSPIMIRQQIRHAILFTAAVGVMMICLFFSGYMIISQWIQTQDNIRAHAQRTGSGCIFSLSFDDPADASGTLQSLDVLSAFQAVAVYRKDGELFTRYAPSGELHLPGKIDPANSPARSISMTSLAVTEPIFSGSDIIGYVSIAYKLSGFYRTLFYSLMVMIAGLLMAQWLEHFVGRRFQQTLATPIEELSATVQRVTKTADYTVRADERTLDEVGQLARDFNKMLMEVELRDEQLLLKERRFRALVDQAVDIIFLVRENGQLADCNPLALTTLQQDRNQLLALRIEDVIPLFDAGMFSRLWAEAVSGGNPVVSTTLHCGDQPGIPAEVKLGILHQDDEVLLVAFCRDISLRVEAAEKLKHTEERLRHSQKMDSIGQLAGGIAHDFNNMLMGIAGAAELLLFSVNDEQDKQYLDIILASVKRASDITKKLLLFSRKNEVESKPFDACQCVKDALVLLCHSVDPRIRIIEKFDVPNPMVAGESSLIQNVVLNLGINARDAIDGAGEISFSVTNTRLRRQDCEETPFDLRPGEYVRIDIQDTGCGMSEDLQKKIFDPFFTTKDVGKGTGMGLSTAYGTIMEHAGSISVKSRVGAGSTFTILLPTIKQQMEMDAPSNAETLSSGSAIILLIDDEPVVRTPVAGFLRQLGYTVIEAENGKEGFQIYRQNPKGIDLVILDMLMPLMNGEDCFREMKKLAPDVKAIMISGYKKHTTTSELEREGISVVLSKPFTHTELCLAVEKILAT